MNTSKLKTFAQQSRRILMEGVARKALYWGFDKMGNVTDEPVRIEGGMIVRETVVDDPTLPSKWQALRNAIRNKGFQEVVEEASYTWFNRLMAMIILSKNGDDQPQLEYGEGQMQVPMILQRARRGQAGFLTSREQKRLQPILNDYQRETDAFGILILGYCHQHPLLNNVFGRVDDYTELLLPVDILASTGFIHLLNTTDAISADDYRQVELIGWLYQFYISEKKDEVFAAFKQNIKAEARDIPAATQIFTPNWIVKYMVQNTVGRIWLDLHPESELRGRMKYLVDIDSSQSAVASSREDRLPATGYRLLTNENHSNNSPIITEVAQLKLLDPACGSGHILVEGFDLLYDMYREEFYPNDEAVISILKSNLFGIDIDRRAVQLSQFAILLKASQRYPDILKKGILPQVFAMPEPVDFSKEEILEFLGNEGFQYMDKLTDALLLMKKAQNLGSIMRFDISEKMRQFLVKRLQELNSKSYRNIQEESILKKIEVPLRIIERMVQKYEAVVTNPPYMGSSSMNAELKKFIVNTYFFSKSDLFAVFMEVCMKFTIHSGKMGMINQHGWMFLSSFEQLRVKIISSYTIENMIHLGPRTFDEISGEVVQSTAFVLQNKHIKDAKGYYFRLVDYKNSKEKKSNYLKGNNVFNDVPQSNFSKIPGSPIVYWMSLRIFELFNSETQLSDFYTLKSGKSTDGRNEQLFRFWYEINFNRIKFDTLSIKGINSKWVPLNKGGSFKKWYGNLDYVCDTAFCYDDEYLFKKGITWSDINSGKFNVRLKADGIISNNVGKMAYGTVENINYLLAFLNTPIADYLLKLIIPTLHFDIGYVGALPLISHCEDEIKIKIFDHVNKCISISQKDWNNREESWDFNQSLLHDLNAKLKNNFYQWHDRVSKDFFKLHHNEEELNRIFIEIYGLQDELSPEVPLKEITILQDELDFNELEKLEPRFRELGKDAIELPIKKDEIMRQLISYVIGIFMGRYRLDKPGLNIAHPDPGPEELQPYNYKSHTIHIDDDAIIPLMGNAGQFSDDALHRIKYFLEAEWGEETLVENINFLQTCLDDELESYLLKGFWKDHCRRYKKRPIYWLFASKNNAFQVLVYMHRMNRFTAEKIRSKYLLPHIRHIQGQIARLEANTASLSGQDARRLDQLRKDLNECQEYDLLLKDKADRQIEFDLDDGVVANYKLFKEVVAEIK